MIYHQRDVRWANTLLGLNIEPEYTIGGYGCLLCCISELADIRPDVLNERLKETGGFMGDGLLVFGAVGRATGGKVVCLRMTAVHQDDPFPVDEILNLLATPSGLAVVRVDFGPTHQHYVVWQGDGLVDDPWTGIRHPLVPDFGPNVKSAIVQVIYFEVMP